MIDFATLQGLDIPEGPVKSLAIDGKTVWNRRKFSYVSLGDSIAAGHTINSSWDIDYTKEGLINPKTGEYIYDGQSTQYGYSGTTINGPFTNNVSTKIVRGSYTDLIQKELLEIYGENHVNSISFARSGNTPDDIMKTLGATQQSDGTITVDETKPPVKALKEADLVTVCVGANVLLIPAITFIFTSMGKFINDGDFTELQKVVRANLQTLYDGVPSSVQSDFYEKPFVATYSYKDLFKALTQINPNAKFVFTSVYNPLKYLYLEGGRNGSFRGLLDIIPQMTVLGIEIDEVWKSLFASYLTNFTKYLNTIADWTEEHVEGSATYDGLNRILRKSIEEFGNDNIVVAETKSFYESFPDRPISADVHYNDLINLQITAGYDLGDMDWSKLWGAYGKTREEYWTDLITKYGTDMGGIVGEFMVGFAVYVLPHYIDPHPFEEGQAMLARSFADTIKSKFNIDLGYDDLVHYNLEYNPNTSNGGAGEAEITEIIGLNSKIFVPIKKLKFTKLSAQTGYRLGGWKSSSYGDTSAYCDVEGNLLGYYIKPTSNDTLYPQWSNQYLISYKHTRHTGWYGDDETGHKECYALYINGVEMPDFGKFSEGSSTVYSVPAGSTIKVAVSNFNPTELVYDDVECNVYWNGASKSSGYRGTTYQFTLNSDIDIDFRWKTRGTLATADARSWEDCHITTLDASCLNVSQPYSITYNANGGTGSMATQKILRLADKPVITTLRPLAFTHPTEGYYFTGWKDQNGNSYSNGQLVSPNSDITLYAQWSNLYTVIYRHSESSWAHDESATGPMENYAAYHDGKQVVGGNDGLGLGPFTNPPKQIPDVPYGTKIKVWVKAKYGEAKSYVNLNGSLAPGTSVGETAEYTFTLKGNADIHFEWVTAGVAVVGSSFWRCHITTQ